MDQEPLRIKRRADDGNRVITVRIREDILTQSSWQEQPTGHEMN